MLEVAVITRVDPFVKLIDVERTTVNDCVSVDFMVSELLTEFFLAASYEVAEPFNATAIAEIVSEPVLLGNVTSLLAEMVISAAEAFNRRVSYLRVS